jgi:peptidoglycan recognition protein
MIARETWGGKAAGAVMARPALGVVIHHSYRPDVPASATQEQEMEHMRAIERYHLHQRWAGIGYNFLIFQSGRLYEGRGWGRTGAHAGQPANRERIGVCFVIDGDVREPSTAAWEAARALILAGIAQGDLPRDYEVTGHRDHMDGRTCPGARVYAVLSRLAPVEVLGTPPVDRPPAWLYSRTAGWILPVLVESDARWLFVRAADLTLSKATHVLAVPVIRAATPLSQMPPLPEE